MVSDGVIALAIIILALVYTKGAAQIWHIYVLMAIRSLVGAFQWPAMQASTTLMSMTPVGLALAGPVADLMCVRIWYLVARVVIALMSVGAFFVPPSYG